MLHLTLALLAFVPLTPSSPVAAQDSPRCAAPPAAERFPARARSGEWLAPRAGGFVANGGQWPEAVLFRVGARGTVAWLERGGFTLARVAGEREPRARSGRDGEGPERPTRGHALRLSFEGARADVRVGGEEVLAGTYNWLLGDDPRGFVRGVRAFERVRYRGLLPGIDLLVRGEEGPEGRALFAYDLLLEPGAQLDAVRVRIEGARSVRLEADGSLCIETPLGDLRQRAPIAWTVDGEGRRAGARVAFRVLGADRFGFAGPAELSGRALVVDPGFQWGTFLGGGDTDVGQAIALLNGDEPLVAGHTYSVDFPTSAGVFDPQLSGSVDAFVTALTRSGRELVFSTYLGGGGDDFAYGVAVSEAGEVFVAGDTLSSDFPTPGGWRTTPVGARDAFVARLDASGSLLLSATYLGSPGEERLRGLALGPSGEVVVCGNTTSPAFPIVFGGQQGSFGGGPSDAFVTRFDAGLANLLASTFLGGSQSDTALAVACHSDGSVLVGGRTFSLDFPTGPIAWNALSSGGGDGFLARLDSQHAALFATYLGGSGNDSIEAVAFGPQDDAVVAGWTESSDLPLMQPAQATFGGFGDALVARFDSSGAQLLESTYLGGWDFDRAYALAVDGAGRIAIAGGTWSADFPTTSRAFDRTFASPPGAYQGDGFVALLEAGALAYSTFLGGVEEEEILALAQDVSGQVFVTGHTTSYNFPIHHTAFDPGYDFSLIPDGFLARLDFDSYPLEYGQGKTTSMGWEVFLYFSGFPSLSASPQGGLLLYIDAAYPNRPAWLFRGPAAAQTPFMGGTLLVAPPITRVATFQLDVFGGATVPVPTTPDLVGTSAYFQFWFQDPGDAYGMGLSPAYEVTFYP